MAIFTGIARTAAATAASFVLLAGVASADMSADLDTQAAEIEQAIALSPDYESEGGPISVDAVDGRIVLTGFVSDLQQMNEIEQMLQDMEGLDMDLVDNNIIQQ